MCNMSANRLKSALGEFLIALADLLSKQKKVLDQQSFQKELDAFKSSYDFTAGNFDVEKFQSDFIQFLKNKNYACEGMSVSVLPKNADESDNKECEVKKPSKNIRSIKEDLNERLGDLEMFIDTTKMAAGMVSYTIKKIAPSRKKPYATYVPEARIITQIHDNGVNGGTIFFTYAHKFIRSVDFNGEKEAKVDSESEALYTPLTKVHAEYICKLLNVQSRLFYKKQMKELLCAEQSRQQKTK